MSLKESLKDSYTTLSNVFGKLTAGWKPYVEQPLPQQELAKIMMGASIPSFGYFFMLLLSTVIATLGLLYNSAPAIIGAMIIAPLMAPIVSFSYSINVFDWKLTRRSFLTVVTGVLLAIAISYLSTRVIGLRIAGSEILSRTSPTLLDLGIAMAAGTAAAFSYTRKSIISSIAGVAIAVALLPPLAVVGIGLAYGDLGASEVGLSLTELGNFSGVDIAKGAFILFATNLLGIIFVACLVYLTQGYGQWKKAGIGLITVLVLSIIIIDPLQKALYKLTVKSEALELLVTLPQKYPQIFTNQGRVDSIHVSYQDDILHVEIEGTIPRTDETNEILKEKIDIGINVFQQYLEQELNTPVIVEVSLMPVEFLNVRSKEEYLDIVDVEESDKLDKENSLNPKIEHGNK